MLGLALTGAVALAGLLRARRKRGILARELAAVERAVELAGSGARGGAHAVERALDERRTRARGLLADGALDEAQFGVIERRIEEHLRRSRLGAIEDELGFLPMSVGKILRGFLADGVIESWERDTVFRALDQETHLTPEQKERARRLVDEWARSDAGRQP